MAETQKNTNLYDEVTPASLADLYLSGRLSDYVDGNMTCGNASLYVNFFTMIVYNVNL